MRFLNIAVLGLAASLLGLAPSPAFVQDSAKAEKLDELDKPHRVLSFNIRYGSADDGLDHWKLRRPRVVATMTSLNADVVGLQETESFQVRELLAALPRYAAVGVQRDDGLLSGEGTTLLYDRTRYTLAAAGTYWLSDTPDVAGSNTFGAACNRTCTWARLVDLEIATTFYVYNTHFDHKSQVAREKSAALLVRKISARGDRIPFVVTGDLNADEANPALLGLMRGGEGWSLVDSYRVHHPDEEAGTYTAFRVDSGGGSKKIDYVLCGPGLHAVAANIDRRKIDGRYPSDHFPVWADLRFER